MKSNKQDRFLIVGRLGRSRGIAGELWVTPETDFPERFEELEDIYVMVSGKWINYGIDSARLIGDRPVLKFNGIKNKEEAAHLTNMKLAVMESQAVELAEGIHYIFELIGCKVIDSSDNSEIGELVDILTYPANDVYVIRNSKGNQLLFPAVTKFVTEIDKEKMVITINRDGLVDQSASSGSQ